MPRFAYIAKPEPSRVIQGTIDAESEQDAVSRLMRQGYFPLSVALENVAFTHSRGSVRFRKISGTDIVLFTRQLSTLIESGVNIINSLDILSNQLSNRYLRSVVIDIAEKIKNGASLSEGLGSYPRLFSTLYSAMVHTGEMSGKLPDTLRALAEYLEKEDEFKDSIRAALTYPAFVCIVGIATVVALVGFVIPRLVTMFEDMGQALPLPTRILIALSEGFRSYWWLALITVTLAVFLLQRSRRHPAGRFVWDTLWLRLPFFGALALKAEMSRLMRSLALLISGGMPITSSLDVSLLLLNNQVLKASLGRVKEQVAGGVGLSEALRNTRIVNSFVTNIVAIGEETGALEGSFLRIANGYEREIDRTLKVLARLLEPVIIVVMGLIVGFIVLSMLLPIFQINLIVS